MNYRHNDVLMFFFHPFFLCDFPIAPIAPNVENYAVPSVRRGGWPASVECLDVSAILRDARKIGDMLEVDDAESSPLVG